MKKKINVAFTLTPEAIRLLTEMADEWGLNRSAMMEVLIREKAREEKKQSQRKEQRTRKIQFKTQEERK
jgi:DNA-binding PadR family transcriptional regulator